MNIIKKVIAVERIAVEDIILYDRISEDKVIINTSKPYERLNIKAPADLDLDSKIENKVRMFSAKLVFSIYASSFQTGCFLYIVHLADGSRLVLGSNDKPFPVEETVQKLSSDHSSSELIKVVINYKSHLAIAESV